ncbi:MAG TPA: hypothetical protein VIG99_33545 [Myxococcaceae bacterium]|jgi:hypothetical protein
MGATPVGIAGTGISLQQIEGTVAGLDKAASTIAGVFSPTAKIVDTVGSAIGLPDPIKQIAKIAVGIGTGDIAGIFAGAFGLAGDLMEALAATQYQPPADPAKAGHGYAPPPGSPAGHCRPTPPPPPPPCGPPRVDPDLLREKQALETLARDFDAIDNAGGLWFRDGKFGGLDMAAVMNGDFPQEMKQAVRYFQEHPEKYCRMDRSDGFDGLVTRGGLQTELARVNAEIQAQGGAHEGGPVTPGPCVPPSPPASSLESRALSKLGAAQGEVDRLTEAAMEHPDDKQLQLQLQKAQERVTALFNLISDMYKHDADMRKHVADNMR